jgi:hypothetical protein
MAKIGQKRKGTAHSPHPRPRAGQRQPPPATEATPRAKRTCAIPARTKKGKAQSDAPPKTAAQRKRRRIAIVYFYEQYLSSPPETEWKGRDGTISILAALVKLPLNEAGVIKRTLLTFLKAERDGVEYTGNVSSGSGGHNAAILKGSVDEDLVAVVTN